jgi:hypothetical protein
VRGEPVEFVFVVAVEVVVKIEVAILGEAGGHHHVPRLIATRGAAVAEKTRDEGQVNAQRQEKAR